MEAITYLQISRTFTLTAKTIKNGMKNIFEQNTFHLYLQNAYHLYIQNTFHLYICKIHVICIIGNTFHLYLQNTFHLYICKINFICNCKYISSVIENTFHLYLQNTIHLYLQIHFICIFAKGPLLCIILLLVELTLKLLLFLAVRKRGFDHLPEQI